MSRLAISTIFIVASVAAASAATTITTPFAVAELNGLCVVTNVSKKPAIVSGRLTDAAGVDLDIGVDQCSAGPLAPGQSCGLSTAMAPTGTLRGFHCSIVSSTSKVRVAAYGTNVGGIIVVLPGTK